MQKHLEADSIEPPVGDASTDDAEELMEYAAAVLALAVRERCVHAQEVTLLSDDTFGFALMIEWQQDRCGARLEIAVGHPFRHRLHVPARLVPQLPAGIRDVVEANKRWVPGPTGDKSSQHDLDQQRLVIPPFSSVSKPAALPQLDWQPTHGGSFLVLSGADARPREGHDKATIVLQRSQIEDFGKAIAKAERFARRYLASIGGVMRVFPGDRWNEEEIAEFPLEQQREIRARYEREDRDLARWILRDRIMRASVFLGVFLLGAACGWWLCKQ